VAIPGDIAAVISGNLDPVAARTAQGTLGDKFDKAKGIVSGKPVTDSASLS
jgi:hypothetical protein